MTNELAEATNPFDGNRELPLAAPPTVLEKYGVDPRKARGLASAYGQGRNPSEIHPSGVPQDQSEFLTAPAPEASSSNATPAATPTGTDSK